MLHCLASHGRHSMGSCHSLEDKRLHCRMSHDRYPMATAVRAAVRMGEVARCEQQRVAGTPWAPAPFRRTGDSITAQAMAGTPWAPAARAAARTDQVA